MRFSLFSVLEYDAQGTSTLSSRYEHLLDQVVEADRLGFDAYWLGEHHGYLTPGYAFACPNPAVVLAAAARLTQHIRLNTAVANLSLRHPLLLAEDYALVDLLSQGRLGLGIGRGSYPHEYAAFGQNREESRARAEESWDIIQQAWRGETVNVQGRYYQIDGFHLPVLPVQQPLPRYWFSVMRPETFAALGRAAQPIIAFPHLSADSPETLSELARAYQHHYQSAGGDTERYELPLFFYTCLAPTREEAQQQGRSALLRSIIQQHPGVDVQHACQQVERLEERQQLWFGSPNMLISWIEQYQALVDSRHFVFWLDFGGTPHASIQRSMRLLAREVLPHFGVHTG